MAKTRWHIVKRRRTPKQKIDRLFQDTFNDPRHSYKDITLCGWLPIDDLYGDDSTAETGSHQRPDADLLSFVDATMSDQAVKVYETATDVVVEIVVPAAFHASLRIDVRDNIITLTGKQSILPEQLAETDMMDQHFHQTFRRTIPLPIAPQPGQVSAESEGETVKIYIRKEILRKDNQS